MRKTASIPGIDRAGIDGITELNNAGDDPNEIARQRERHIRGTAMAATGGDGEIADGPEIGAGNAITTRVIDGRRVRVSIPPVSRNPDVTRYGREQTLPAGTPVTHDGKPCEGAEEPYGVIGSVMTERGWLVGRVVPLADESEAA